MIGRILIADDDKSVRTVLSQAFIRAGCKVKSTSLISTLCKWIDEGEGDIIISDIIMLDGDILEVIPLISSKRPNIPIILISGQNNVLTTIKVNELGVYEYFPKPFNLKDILTCVNNALKNKEKETKTVFESSKKSLKGSGNSTPIIGRSSAMQEVYKKLAKLTNTDLAVLVSGDTGTGKKLFSKTLHFFSKRKNNKVEKISLSSLTEDKIEKEIFGFENQKENKIITGKLELANKGTLILDEIGEMPPKIQKLILGFLNDGHFFRVEGIEKVKSDVRIISTTKFDIFEQVKSGKFREDLFYKLNIIPVKMPNLVSRINDIPDLCNYFFEKLSTNKFEKKSLSNKSYELIKRQPWNGNVRELRNFVQRLIIRSSNKIISYEEVLSEINIIPNSIKVNSINKDKLAISINQHLKRYFELHGESLPPPGLYDRFMKEIEMSLISFSLKSTKGNQLKAAYLLGINRNTLRKKIKELDIELFKRKEVN